MKVLILGSEGFIGSHLVNHFIDIGWHVSGCDLIEKSSVRYVYQKISLLSADIERLFDEEKYDVCVNAAGSGNVGFSISHPLSDFEANTLAVIHILEAIRNKLPKCKYIHISSAAVYGNPAKLPVKEDDELNPSSPYGWHKLMSELLCKEYTHLYHLQTAIVRPFSVFGPGLKKQLLWDIYQKYLSSDDSIELWGTGNESRDFIYISDVASAIEAIALKADFKSEAYNLASGKETGINDIAKLFLSKFSKKVEVNFNQHAKIGDPLNWCADISKLNELGFEPKVSMEDGIDKLVKWISLN